MSWVCVSGMSSGFGESWRRICLLGYIHRQSYHPTPLFHAQLAALAFLGMWKEESKLSVANPISANCPHGCDVQRPYSPGQPILMLSDCQQLA